MEVGVNAQEGATGKALAAEDASVVSPWRACPPTNHIVVLVGRGVEGEVALLKEYLAADGAWARLLSARRALVEGESALLRKGFAADGTRAVCVRW